MVITSVMTREKVIILVLEMKRNAKRYGIAMLAGIGCLGLHVNVTEIMLIMTVNKGELGRNL